MPWSLSLSQLRIGAQTRTGSGGGGGGGGSAWSGVAFKGGNFDGVFLANAFGPAYVVTPGGGGGGGATAGSPIGLLLALTKAS